MDFGYGICSFPNCGKYAKTRKHQLCGGHDSQMRKGLPLAPIGTHRYSDVGVEGWRRCTNCDEIKKTEEFYKRKNGIYMSQCKACVIKKNRNNALARQGRPQNAH